jgi:hypothetical protein
MSCEHIRGIAGTDYFSFRGECWLPTVSIKILYPELKSADQYELADKLYEQVGHPIMHLHPWRKVFEAVTLALGMPLVLLILWLCSRWVISGFEANVPK